MNGGRQAAERTDTSWWDLGAERDTSLPTALAHSLEKLKLKGGGRLVKYRSH
jgi:hypothetical protein